MSDAGRRVEVLSKLVEVSVTLNSTLELDALLRLIISAAAELIGTERASILLLDEHANELRFSASTGSDPEVLAAISVPMDASIAGAIFRENRPIIVDDLPNDPRHYRKVGQQTGLDMRNLIGVPMRVKDRITGVIEAVNKIDGAFTEEDSEILSILADQAAVAIHNARMLDDLQSAHRNLAELDRMKSAFIAIASHELRTPLVVILGYADLLRTVGNDQTKEFGRRLLASGVKMRNLIEDLTNLRYLETGVTPEERELTDLREVVARARQDILDVAEAKLQTITLEECPTPLPVKVDRPRMMVALTKLLANAIAFTPESGEIRVRSFPRANEGWVQVDDQGKGLPPGQEESIFERFYQLEDHMTRKHGGMGLGLSIVRGTAQIHGGRTWAENLRDRPGSRFTLVIPLASEAPQPTAV